MDVVQDAKIARRDIDGVECTVAAVGNPRSDGFGYKGTDSQN